MEENTANKNQYQAQLFGNRLSKKYKQLRKWARRERVTCYRLYDRDIPEVPLAADLYEFLPPYIDTKLEAANFMREIDAQIAANNLQAAKESQSRKYLHLYLYERPYEKDEKEEEEWMQTMAQKASEVLEIPFDHVITKLRKKQKGENQYEKIEAKKQITGIAQESGQLFNINLSDYLDTGLFLDHRPLRNIVRQSCAGKSVLNLFCYTGSFSVYAAEGKASRVESVDLSNTYIAWAKRNLELNGFTDPDKYVFTRGDVIGFLNQKNAEVKNPMGTNRYDVIVLDPPTFSNSKNTESTLDINRDWSNLVTKCLNLLNERGILYFSTNSRRLSFDRSLIPQATANGAVVSVTDITEETLGEDYKGTKMHRCWKLETGKVAR